MLGWAHFQASSLMPQSTQAVKWLWPQPPPSALPASSCLLQGSLCQVLARPPRMGQHGEGMGTGINSELCCEMFSESFIPLSHSFLFCKTKRTVPASQDCDRSMSEFTYLKRSVG